MDFLERFFGLSPDGGNGLTEAGIIAVVMAIAVLLAVRRSTRRKQAG